MECMQRNRDPEGFKNATADIFKWYVAPPIIALSKTLAGVSATTGGFLSLVKLLCGVRERICCELWNFLGGNANWNGCSKGMDFKVMEGLQAMDFKLMNLI